MEQYIDECNIYISSKLFCENVNEYLQTKFVVKACDSFQYRIKTRYTIASVKMSYLMYASKTFAETLILVNLVFLEMQCLLQTLQMGTTKTNEKGNIHCSRAFFGFHITVGSPVVAVIGGEASLRWTISTSTDGIRIVSGPDNATKIAFINRQTKPYYVATNINYTGDITQGIMSFTLYEVALANIGKYRYILPGNIENGGQDLLIAESPEITGIKELSPPAVSGSMTKFNCSAVSTSIPANHNLTMLSEWKKNGNDISQGSKYNVIGTILVIDILDRTDNENRLTCRAYEDPRRKSNESNEYILNVLYGPDNVQITPVGDFSVVEGTMLNISCSAECNPVCDSYRWQNGSDNSLLGSSQSLVIPKVRREHAGVYFCTVINSAISKSAKVQVNVTVNYPPDVLVDYSGSTFTNSTVLLTCIASGHPSQYTFHEWVHKVGETEIRKLTGQNTANTSILTLPNISIEDMGTYMCSVDNSITGLNGQIIQTGHTDIFVRGTPLIENKNSMFIGMINKSARIEIPFYSNPSSKTVKFYRCANNVEVTNTSDTLIFLTSLLNTFTFYGKEVFLNGQVAVLHFRTVLTTEYGEYTAVLFNDIGNTYRRIVFSSGEPEVPEKFHVTDVAEKQVTLQWLSGNHKGFDQTFVVQISMDNITWTNASLLNAGKKEGWFSTTITGLKSYTTYYFRLYSFNVNGEGEFADINVVTRTLKESVSSLDIGASLGIGFGGIFLGVVGTISVIIIRKRITATPKYGSTSEIDMSTDLQTYYNTRVSSSPAPSPYEELQQDSMEKTIYDHI
ncbi:hypothetical protein CHS0354_039081 [Potamilus streckersoni]|uniref:HMCN n=1 Tax=Potamilus streckersoni TaxID=2493646 RepID=A0AAE0SYH6_9BIVA|nr:hypothetical protein CHS0354_039081 [Potamilus streckersoni]